MKSSLRSRHVPRTESYNYRVAFTRFQSRSGFSRPKATSISRCWTIFVTATSVLSAS